MCFVICIACANGDVRLMNGSEHTSTLGIGRVEICYNNSYWSVCDDRWDILDAGVVCRQLDARSSSEIQKYRALHFLSSHLFLSFSSSP